MLTTARRWVAAAEELKHIMCLKAFVVARRQFEGRTHLSLAPDASRICRRSMVIGWVSSPDNMAMFGPPMASTCCRNCGEMAFDVLGSSV